MFRSDSRRGLYVTATVLGFLLALAVGVAFSVWRALAEVELGLHGIVALLLGVGVTLALGIGLMCLVYFSHRHGYDERAGYD